MMASKYWIKLYQEILFDPKMMEMPELLFARCIKYFLMAGEENDDGKLPSLHDMAFIMRPIPEEEIETDLIELQKMGIVQHTEGEWYVTNFERRQAPISGKERTALWRKSRDKEKWHGDDTSPHRHLNQIQIKDTESDKEATKKEIAYDAIHKKFATMTGLKEPFNNKKAREDWWDPIIEIVELADSNETRAVDLVAKGINRNRDRDLNISRPKSILSSINSIIAEEKLPRKDDKPMSDKEWLRQNVRSNT